MAATEWMWAARCAVAAVCFVGATVLAFHGKDGWGWIVFAGLLVIPLFPVAA